MQQSTLSESTVATPATVVLMLLLKILGILGSPPILGYFLPLLAGFFETFGLVVVFLGGRPILLP